MLTARGVEILLGVGAAWSGLWVLKAFVTPDRPCRWCGGKGTNWWSNGERRGRCWFCHGDDSWRPTRGARLIRRLFRGDRWGK